MKTVYRSIKPGLIAGLLFAAGSLFAYELHVGQESVMPGASVQVPVLIDDATDISTIQLQINYDPQLLTLTSVTNFPWTMGGAFSLNYEDDDGVLVVILYRTDSLPTGSGELFSIRFESNSGSKLLMESALTLAEVGLGNQDGKDLAWESSVSVVNGAVNISPSSTADSDEDGMPDLWELDYSGGHTNLSPFVDSDGDGVSNFGEYALDGDPTNIMVKGTFPTLKRSGSGFIYIHPQRPNATAISYQVEATTNLITGVWTNKGFTAIGTNVTGGTLDFVTNDVSTIEKEKFFRLKISR